MKLFNLSLSSPFEQILEKSSDVLPVFFKKVKIKRIINATFDKYLLNREEDDCIVEHVFMHVYVEEHLKIENLILDSIFFLQVID